MSSSTIPNACPGLRVSGSPGPSSSATSTKSTSPTCERGWQGSSRQDKRGSNYLRTNRQPTSEKAIFQRFVKLFVILPPCSLMARFGAYRLLVSNSRLPLRDIVPSRRSLETPLCLEIRGG